MGSSRSRILPEDTFKRRRWVIGVIVLLFFVVLLATGRHYKNSYNDAAYPRPPPPPHGPHGPQHHSPHLGDSNTLEVKQFRKPPGTKLIGLVFFGRRNRVEIMRCFLERSLVDNGGWLDEVHWVQNTDKKADLEYLDEILASSHRYKKIDLSSEGVGFVGYGFAWGHLERNTLYIKIDDDVVWFADDVIPRIVTLKLENPQYLLTSANIINSPLMGWLHYHMGAMHPYLPEYDVWDAPMIDIPRRRSWRYTDYPYWQGPQDYFFDMDQDPPYKGHRWLRMQNESGIYQTPIVDIEYKTWGTGLKSWAIASQEHYSFLENLADDRLDRYKFGKAWITDYRRLSINFMCIWSNDVLDNLPMDTVDEEWLTINLPKRLGRSVAVESDALAVHFTFGTQGKVEDTDLLARYHDYAAENVCRKKM